MDPNTVPRKLWEHPNPESTLMHQFMQELNEKERLQLKASLPLQPRAHGQQVG